MNLNEELRLAIKRVGIQKVAKAFDVTPSVIHKWVETGQHHRKNPMEDYLKLMEVLDWDEEFMRCICGRAGGCFVKDPPMKSGQSKDLMTVENAMLEEFGALMKTIGHAAHNKNISPPDACSIRKGWDGMKSVTEGFVVGCEAGNFDAYHAHAAKLQANQIAKPINNSSPSKSQSSFI